MNERKDLKSYLILRFVFTLLPVALAEVLLSGLIGRTILPVVTETFFGGGTPGSAGAGGYLLAAAALLATLLLQLLRAVLPDQLGILFQGLQQFLEQRIQSAFIKTGGIDYLSRLGLSDRIMLFLILSGFLILLITPVLLGALFYSTSVVRKVRQLEEEDRQRALAEEKRRNKLLSDIAHDLRTPLTTVMGYAGALSDDLVAPEKQAEYLTAIKNKSQRMSELLNLLLDYVRLDSEGFALKKEETDLCELLRECIAEQYEELEEAGADPEIGIGEEALMISCDRLQLSRVFYNLLTNAMRHNPEGTCIGIYCIKKEGRIRIYVADGGPLIDKERAETIFDPFVMGDDSRSSKKGSGLGLSIVKKILTMHGYSIRLLQRPDQGLTPLPEKYGKAFEITIPCP